MDRYIGQHRTGTAAHADREPGKKLVIEDLTIKNATATVTAAVMQRPPVSVPLPDLHLRDIGKQSGGATAGEAVKQVLAALTQSVTRTIASRNLGGLIDSLKTDPGSAVDTLKGLFR